MTDKYIFYDVDGKNLKVPVDRQKEFEERLPDAKMMLTFDGKNHKIPISQISTVVDRIGADNLAYSVFDENKEYVPNLSTRSLAMSWDNDVEFDRDSTANNDSLSLNDYKKFVSQNEDNSVSKSEDKTNIFETIGKGLGAAGVGTAKLALDLGQLAYNISPSGMIARALEGKKLDEALQDESNPLTRASMKLGELQERLSREADPTGGQMGFGELLKEGKVGMALQKALGSGLESLPMMVAAGTGVGSLVYGAALAAGTYADETRDNPEIPAWKRGINSIGSAALEMAVEKIGGPLKNLGGKAAKEITEETATEILKNFAKEGTETVSKRIFNTLKNIGKEGLEEGGEELITSFGNDALGEALDLIDGDKDYGIRAQWEQMKEQDPNADLGDFAKSKAKEYFDAFLGGALSGMEISGTVQGINAAATPKNDMQRRYDLGASLDYQDMYDADEVVKESADIAAKSFESKDGTSSISREFLDGLSADETYNLSRSDEFSNEQRTALRNLAGAKAMQNGLNDKLDTRLEAEIASARAKIEKVSNEDGSIVAGIYNNSPVYVKGAVVKNETVTLPNGKDGPVIIVNPKTGEETTVNSKDISSAISDSYSNFFSNVEEGLRLREQERRNTARNTMSLKAKYNAIKPYVGKKIMVDLGNGIIEVGVQQILPESGEVLVKGKKGDLGGNAIEKIGIGAFYDSIARDDAGNPMFAEGEIETEVEPEDTNVETPQEAEVTEEDDFRDTVAPILINRVPVEVEVVSQDNATNRIVYRYTDENGQERTGTVSIGEFKTALQQAQEYKPEEPIVPEVPTEPTIEATTEPTPAPTDVPTEIESVAEEINWDALFEQDQEAFFAELQNQFGDETLDILNEFVAAAQDELDSLNKKKRSSNPNDILATRNQKAALQKRIDAYNQMIARITPAPEAPVVEEPTSETPVETAPTEEPIVEPAPTESVEETPVTEVPTDGKSENGFEFNKHNVCTNPEVISVPSVKKGWAVMNEVRLAEFNGKWGSAIDAHTGTGGVGIPLTKSDCKFDTKEEAIADAYKALVSYRASRNGDTGLKDLDNLIKHLEKEYPFVKEAAIAPTETTPAPQPAPAEPITTENGFVIVDKVITNPEVIEMPNTPKGDANRIFIGEYNGKWTYGAEALMDNGSWGMTPQMRIENAKYDTREEAIKAAISFLENQWRNKRKDAGSAALDAFLDYVKDNYLPKASETEGNSVSLENEPIVENNGSEGETASNETEGQGADNMGGRADNEGTNAGEETIAEEQSAHENSDNAEGGLDDKYPPRKGDVTPKDLENTFGFKHVATILPQSVLNSSYDVFMGMAKMLGISPKSITHGGELRLAKMDDSAPKGYDAAYSQDGRNNNRVQYTAIKLREGRNLAGVAHEWWHSLDHMLRHWNSGRGSQTTTNSSANTFDGRPEVLSAVKDLLKAIKDSGHISRIDGLGYSSSDKTYLKSRVEQTARAFEEYIIGKFAEAGITIEGVYKDSWIAQPTAEEMKIIAPAFDNLFKVLQEKEGRNPGSSVLYHIGEMMEQNNEAKNQLGALVADWIKQGGNFVVMDNEAMLNALEESGNARMLETPDGVIYGFVKDGVVYLNPSLLNANTSIHEYTHLWDNALMQLNRPLWEKGKALMKKTALWKEVVNDPNYADIKDNEDLVASEVHSRLVGTEGAKRLEQLEQEAREKGLTKGAKDLSILGRLREWLKEATQWLKDTFSVWSKEEIDAVSLDDFINMPLRDLATFTALPQAEQKMPEDNLSEETREELADHGLVMEGGAIMSEEYAKLKSATGYKTPIEKGQIQFSYGTRQAHIANYLQHPEAEQRVVDLLERFAERLSINEIVNGIVSTTTKHKYVERGTGTYAGPLRENVEYVITFDLDTTCPRTFQYLNLVKTIEKRIGRPLTQTECIQLIEMMRMYGQQIPCVYCYAENKRQSLKDGYTRFMNARHAVLSAETDEEALKHMYGRNESDSTNPKEVLTNAAYKVFLQWRKDRKSMYNPSIKALWSQYSFDRDCVLTLLDSLYGQKKIDTNTPDITIAKAIADEFKITSTKAMSVIEEIVGEWKWDTIEGKQHEDFTPVDEDDLGINEKAFDLWRDMTNYAKSMSSAKGVIRYTPYTDELKYVSKEDRDYVNGMGGVRMHSTNDFRIDYVFDYFQFMADMALYKMFGHTYTKSPEFVRIFGNSGYKINMSIAAYQDENGNIRPNADEGFDWEEAKRLRKLFPNAGTMLMATSDEQIQMALDSDWIDMVIPFHQSGLPKAVWGNMRMWTDYQNIQKEKFYNNDDKKAALKAEGIEIPKKANAAVIDELYNKHFNIKIIYDKKGKRIAPHFLPGPTIVDGNEIPGHNNDHQRYLELCREYGVKPRFAGLKVKDNTPEGGGKVVDITEHPRYMILVKETARTDSPQTPIKFNFDEPSEALDGKTPLDYAFEELESRAMAESEIEGKPVKDIYNSLKKDQFGIVDQFINSFIKYKNETGKELPLDYLTPDSREWFLVQRKALEEAFKDVETIPYHRNEYDENGNLINQSNTTAEVEDDGILSRSGDITPEMDAAYMEAVERGDMETAQRMVNEAADKYLNEMLLPDDSDEVGFKYHRGPAPTKTFKRYAVFNVKDGGFHAAYAGNATPTPVGVWLDAQNLQSYVSDKTTLDNGTPATYVKGDTGFDIKSKFSDEKAKEYGLKGTKMLLERGGKHSSDVPNFSQMNLGKDENGNPVKSREKDGALPHNKLIFEIEYGISDDGDLTEYVKENGRKIGGKNQGLAKIEPNQYYDFKTNPNAVGNWGIGGTFRITRLVPHSEVVSVTEQYKKDAIAEANRLYEKREISKKDRDTIVKSAESIQVQKWVGGYNPADFGLSEEVVKQMAEEGSKMKLTDAVTYDDNGNVIPLSERFNPEKKDIRYRKSDIQNAAVDYLAGEPRNRAIENAVNEEAAKLGVTVTYKTRSEMPNGHKNDKGYYNTKTGEIVVCTENNTDINDAIQTIIHEAVAHKGLRQLMGDRFNEFINRVYDALDAETKAKVDELAAKHYNGNKAVAMEEYMATLAESENFAETSAWDKIKSIFEKIINSILGRNDIKIGDNELRYILRASYANMVNPRNMETIEGWAKDTNMREEYKINEATPEILSRTDIDPTVVSTEAARAVYDRTVASVSQEFQRQFQDAYQPVRIAIDAIQQETGNQPIEDYENYLLIQNQSSSRSRVEIDDFSRLYYSPIIDQVNMLIDAILESRGFNKNNKAERSRAYKEIRQYLIAKHGLERNAYYQTRNTRLVKAKTKAERIKSVREDHKDIVDQINNDPTLSPAEKRDLIKQEKKRRDVLIKQIRETDYELDVRDYSGLTALFGLRPEQFEEAEDLAKELVENFESNTGDMTEELWKRINKATNKTLKHSYECGLLSRQQYNEIKSMFEFYIPLRGFDEATAEDVYSYARFEGNKFNPAVAKTGGRTSLADDPLALIMNMAESEIAQGNKNRAKQALYNFLLNRADGMDTQNSLMQIESVWYIKTIDSFGNELYVIASPDHEAGETLEDFEERMKMLEEAGLAKRSKKGNVDVGMRFQKEKNKGSHYIYLKVNGVEKAIYINGDPKAADAVNGVYSEQYGEGMQKIRDIQRAVSSTFTNYSLEFTARNYFRDMVYSHINIGVRESDPAYRKKFRQNWRHNNIKTMLKMLKAYRAGELDNRALTEDEAAFVEFMRNGGQTGYTLINSVENHKKDLERAIRRMQKGIEKGGIKDSTVFKATLGGIELLNEASELVTRFAAFKTSRDMGRDINTSISDAKEVTVNFNTKGAQDGKGFFGIVARYLGAFKYFFNASVQGVQNLWAMMLSNKIKFGTVVGSTIAFGAMMPLIQCALAALLGDDDDENEYWNIPEYERQNNLCFVLGGGRYAKLPLPIGFREMYGLGDMMAAGIANRKVARDPLAVATDVSNKIASIVLPINPLEGAANGLSLVESGTNMLLPDLTQGLIQNRTNVDFKGDPIQKEYTYNENDPQWTKAFSNNPAWIKGLCKWMNENIVIDGVGLDVSPEKLDNTFSNLLGGVYSLVKKSGRAISMAWNEDNRHISNVPLIGVMVGTGIDEDDRFVNSSYWDMNDYYKSRLPYIKRTAENFGYSLDEVFKRVEEGETRAGAHHPKMSKIYNRDNFDWMQEWYLGHKGEGETDENGEPILGIDQYKNKIKYLEKKIKKNENGEPTPEQAEELAKLNADYNKALEGFVYDMLEFD